MADVLSSPTLPVVLVLGSVLNLAVQLLPSLSYLPGVLVAGYVLTYAGRVANGNGRNLPRVDDPIGYVCRGFIGTIAVSVPLLIAAIPVTLIELVPDGEGVVFSLLRGTFVVFGMLTWMAALSTVFLPTVVGSRYAFFDRSREAFRYLEALKQAWLFRREAAATIVFTLAGGLVALIVRYLLGRLLGTRMLASLPQNAVSLVHGNLTYHSVGVMLASLASAALGAIVAVVAGNLLGQFAGVAYGASDRVGLTSAST